jgi:hypothetical protein
MCADRLRAARQWEAVESPCKPILARECVSGQDLPNQAARLSQSDRQQRGSRQITLMLETKTDDLQGKPYEFRLRGPAQHQSLSMAVTLFQRYFHIKRTSAVST